jgi:hypothetical protein
MLEDIAILTGGRAITDDLCDREKVQERLVKLVSGVAVAVEEGIVPGALYRTAGNI